MSGYYARQNRVIAIMLVVAAVLAATFLTVFVAHAQTQRDAPTTRFYDSIHGSRYFRPGLAPMASDLLTFFRQSLAPATVPQRMHGNGC